jgi:hypothetical protein
MVMVVAIALFILQNASDRLGKRRTDRPQNLPNGKNLPIRR